MSARDEKLRRIARNAVPSGVYSGNVQALRAVAEQAWWEGHNAARGYYAGGPHEPNPYEPTRSDADS